MVGDNSAAAMDITPQQNIKCQSVDTQSLREAAIERATQLLRLQEWDSRRGADTLADRTLQLTLRVTARRGGYDA